MCHCAAAGAVVTATSTNTAIPRIVACPQYMIRLIHPFVTFLSPFTNQLNPGYEVCRTGSSTTFPTRSSFVLMRLANACQMLYTDCARAKYFLSTGPDSFPDVR